MLSPSIGAPVGEVVMKRPKPPGRDRTMECLVCGKQFPRGQLDLNRHINAITLQHVASRRQHDNFQFQCAKCGWFFTRADHLEIHRVHSACARSQQPLQIARTMQGNAGSFQYAHDLSEAAMLSEVDDSGLTLHSPMASSVGASNITPIYQQQGTPSNPNHLGYSLQHLPPNPNAVPLLMLPSDFAAMGSVAAPGPVQNMLHPSQLSAQYGSDEHVFGDGGPMSFVPPASPAIAPNSYMSQQSMASGMGQPSPGMPSGPGLFPSSPMMPMGPDGQPMAMNYGHSLPLGYGHHHESSRTMECMICGKLFPRGPIDLQRHATAITLKHLVSPKPALAFPFSCSRCGLSFTTMEHLQMHSSLSTCNPDMVWPDNAASTSGLRTVTRAQAAILAANAQALAAANPQPMAPPPPEKPVVKRQRSESKVKADGVLSMVAGGSGGTGGGGGSNRRRSNSTKDNKASAQPVSLSARIDQLVASLVAPTQNVFAQAGEMATRNKRARVIIPEERKAFFAVISQLVDPGKLGPTTRLTDENFEQFVAPEHLPLVQRLKGILLYTC